MQPRDIVPFAAAAFIGLVAFALPGPDVDWTLYALAAALTLAITVVGFVAARQQRGRPLIVVLPLAYFGVVALLRHSGENPGFAPLILLPVVWLALFGTRREMVVGLAFMAITLLVPFLVFGEPRYSSGAWRSTFVFTVVAGVAGLAIQTLVVRVRANRDRLSGVLRNATETAIIAADASGTITVFNRGAERMLGYDADELIGKQTPVILLDPEELAARAKEHGLPPGRELLEALGPDPRRWTFIRKDGGRLRVSIAVTLERDGAGVVTGFLGIATDVTRRLQAEAELRAERDFSSAVIDTAGSLVMVLDPRGRIARFNRACEQLTGWSEEEAIGQIPTVFGASEQEGARISELMAGASAADYPLSFEIEWRAADGERRLVAWSSACILDSAGGIAHVVAAGTDVTERREALMRAMEASQAKSEFLANMSHELRTPLNGVIGMLELLQGTALSPEQREYARTAATSGDALLGVIDDVLDFSKIEAGRLELDESDFDLRTLVEDASDIVAHQAHQKGVELTVWVDEQGPPLVRGDSGRLRQVLTNLLSNAVKFTAAGEVSVRVRADVDGDRVRVVGEVRDTGIGIDPARIAELFEPFSQEDTSTTRRFGGTGLGLAISRQLVELMGGELSAVSEPGKGSTFRFTAALRAVDGDRPTRRPRTSLPEGLRVLAVDDSATTRQILRGYLDARVTQCDEAESAEDALVMLHTAASNGSPYAVVLLDFQMPGMGGAQLARAIRTAPSLRSARLVMLTSAPGRQEAGVDAYVTKPVHRANLLETVAEVLAPAPERAAQASEPRVPRPEAATATILVAEDNPVNQLVIRGMLAKRDYAVDMATTGREVIERLDPAKHAAVLMDIQMPGLDGYEATRRIRAAENGGHLPIIAMTAGALEGDRAAALEAGMDDYLVKPLRPEQLDAVLERWLGRPPDPTSPVPILDESRIRAFRADYPEIVDRIVAMFADTTPPLLEEIAQAAQQEDRERLRRLAHKLKGSCESIGAARMAVLCRALETSADDHPRLVGELREAYPVTLTEIRAT